MALGEESVMQNVHIVAGAPKRAIRGSYGKGLFFWVLGGFLFLGLHTSAQAEPPIHLPPGVETLLKGTLIGAGALGKTLNEVSPSCSVESQQCWEAKGMNRNNADAVMDACWLESRHCSKICRDTYFELRKSGVSAREADDKVMFGSLSCGLG